MMTNHELHMQLLAYKFCMHELNLYLDSHPRDRRALREFDECRKNYMALRDQYVKKVAPLTAADSNNPDKWEWIENPWPWELKEDCV